MSLMRRDDGLSSKRVLRTRVGIFLCEPLPNYRFLRRVSNFLADFICGSLIIYSTSDPVVECNREEAIILVLCLLPIEDPTPWGLENLCVFVHSKLEA